MFFSTSVITDTDKSQLLFVPSRSNVQVEVEFYIYIKLFLDIVHIITYTKSVKSRIRKATETLGEGGHH